MLRSYRVLTGYTRLKNMADLEKRLVRKLGASDEGFTVPDVRNLTNSRLLHTGWKNMQLYIVATNSILGVLLRCILLQLPRSQCFRKCLCIWAERGSSTWGEPIQHLAFHVHCR